MTTEEKRKLAGYVRLMNDQDKHCFAGDCILQSFLEKGLILLSDALEVMNFVCGLEEGTAFSSESLANFDAFMAEEEKKKWFQDGGQNTN